MISVICACVGVDCASKRAVERPRKLSNTNKPGSSCLLTWSLIDEWILRISKINSTNHHARQTTDAGSFSVNSGLQVLLNFFYKLLKSIWVRATCNQGERHVCIVDVLVRVVSWSCNRTRRICPNLNILTSSLIEYIFWFSKKVTENLPLFCLSVPNCHILVSPKTRSFWWIRS